MTLTLGVLVSGSGTNLQAILNGIDEGKLDAEVRTVISNKADAYALERARKRNVPCQVIPHRDFPTREDFDRRLVQALKEAGVEYVVLAGFMRLVTAVLLRAFPERVVNIHPALLPAFPGVRAQRQAVEYGAKVTGCTVHFVDLGVDTGPIIAQRAVPVLDDDDEHSLSERLLQTEHALMVDTLRALSEGRISIERPEQGRPKVRVKHA